MMMRPGDILGRIFFILSQKSIIGSSEFIHGAHGGHGFFIHGGHVFLVATLEILEEMFFKMLLRKKYCGFTVYLQTKSLTKIFD